MFFVIGFGDDYLYCEMFICFVVLFLVLYIIILFCNFFGYYLVLVFCFLYNFMLVFLRYVFLYMYFDMIGKCNLMIILV